MKLDGWKIDKEREREREIYISAKTDRHVLKMRTTWSELKLHPMLGALSSQYLDYNGKSSTHLVLDTNICVEKLGNLVQVCRCLRVSK